MTDDKSLKRPRWRSNIILLAVVFTVWTVVLNPTGWLGWVLVAALLVALAIHVHRTSRAWLELFGQDVVEFDGQPIPEEVDPQLPPLSELDFGGPVWWVLKDGIGATFLSLDGSVWARVGQSDAGRGPVFATDWPGARLWTSRGLGIPMMPDEYLQVLPAPDVRSLFDAHREAVEVLSRRYGQPVKRERLTIEILNDEGRRRHDFLSSRRYLRTGRALAGWYVWRGYRGRLGAQLGLTTPPWRLWSYLFLTTGLLGALWIYAASGRSTVMRMAAVLSHRSGAWSFSPLYRHCGIGACSAD